MSKSVVNLKERRFRMSDRVIGIIILLLAVIFTAAIVYTISEESLFEIWPSIWGSLWGKVMILDLYLGFLVTTLLFKKLCNWSLGFTIGFLLLCCILGNVVSLIALAVLFYRKAMIESNSLAN